MGRNACSDAGGCAEWSEASSAPVTRVGEPYRIPAAENVSFKATRSITILMDSRIVFRLLSVFPFTPPRMRSDSGSAATLEEEAAKAAFSPPLRRRNRFTCGLSIRLTDHRTA